MSRGEEIETSISEQLQSVNAATVDFQGDLQSAESLLAALSDSEEEFARISDSLDALQVPLAPGTQPSDRYRQALADYLSQTREYQGRLATIASLTVERADAMEELTAGLGVLDELSRPDASEEEIDGVLADAAEAVDSAISAVEALAAAGPNAYSSEALLGRLSGLSTAVKEIRRGLAERDAAAISGASAAFSRLISAEWSPLFFEASREGIDGVVSGLDTLVQQRNEIDSSRSTLDRIRSASAFAALALAIVAGLLLMTAWPR
ncbi:MAG: hypothetical protein RQ731_06845 [Anaerosomatales bacterium]|nr:hypothetical protein [Anaerosomatales bacterium]